MFHTAQWSSEHSMTTPPLKAIQIWAHLTGVPLDLRYDEGLSFVAGLVIEPEETYDFTKNLVSLTFSHVKIEVDLTKPLPPVVEFERETGEVVKVLVHYPWVPPTYSHCHEIGHIVRNCLTNSPPTQDTVSSQKQTPLKQTEKTQKNTNQRLRYPQTTDPLVSVHPLNPIPDPASTSFFIPPSPPPNPFVNNSKTVVDPPSLPSSVQSLCKFQKTP